MSILDRYLIRAILGAVLIVMAALLVLGGLYIFIDQQDDIGVGNYTLSSAMWFTLLNLPTQAYQLLPLTAMIGSLVGLGSLARGSELTVIRATGVSIGRLAGTALLAALLLIGVAIALGEFVAPPLQEAAKEHKAFSKFTNLRFGNSGGAWVRDGNLILNVERQWGERQFGGMQVFELSPDHQLLSIGHAARATEGANRQWRLSEYAESKVVDDTVTGTRSGERTLTSNVTAGFLGLAVDTPSQLTSRSLWRLIQYLNANELDSREYVFAFWSRIARTLAIAFAVLLAIPFVLGSLRSAGAGTRTMIGGMLGVGLLLLQRLIDSGTIVFSLNPIVLAWVPTALLAMVSLTLLARAR